MSENRLTQVLAYFADDNIKRRRELDISNVVATEIDMHQSRYVVVQFSVFVVLDTLNQG